MNIHDEVYYGKKETIMNETEKDIDPVEAAVKAAEPKKRRYILKVKKRGGWKWSAYKRRRFSEHMKEVWREKMQQKKGEKKVVYFKQSLPRYIKIGEQTYVNGNFLVKQIKLLLVQLLGEVENAKLVRE